MKKNPIGKRLKEYTASAINTGGEVYEKIMASGKEHAEEQGAIENALCQLFDFIDYYRQPEIFNHQGTHLLKGLNFFSGLKKSRQEPYSSTKHKYKAMMIRVDDDAPLDTVWGTKWNAEHALRYYFNNDDCFVMEFTNEQEKNLLKNQFISDGWQVDGLPVEKSPHLNDQASLVNVNGIRMINNTVLQTAQAVRIAKGIYSLHFFIRGAMRNSKGVWQGKLNLKIVRKDGAAIFTKTYSCGMHWENIQEHLYFEQDGEYDCIFTCEKNVDIDFINLFPEVPYPSLSILIGHGGMRDLFSIFFAPHVADPKDKDDEKNFKDNEFILFDLLDKYKFWFPFADDSESKRERLRLKIDFNDKHWGYWTEDIRWLDLLYVSALLDSLLPVGVKVFTIISSRRGS
ncbi:hypothetical protein [Treponema phagedenis]|uniref:hypothetical protein n=1 Tax=Treponema phagedenis TaxID=162 RepID=UPI0015A22369|nr:hypothetical protein [Treponema phagedenis]NVP23488.1 hypothetical protein [Treponema phagedenis]QLC58329.1 hypothetical protein HW453_05515 [Treponema phagedenis]